MDGAGQKVLREADVFLHARDIVGGREGLATAEEQLRDDDGERKSDRDRDQQLDHGHAAVYGAAGGGRLDSVFHGLNAIYTYLRLPPVLARVRSSYHQILTT